MAMVAFDLETFLITRERPSPQAVCISWADGPTKADADVATAVDQTARELLVSSHNLVGHNVAYDCTVLCTSFPHLMPLVFEAYRANRITDTGIRQQLWDIAMGRTRDEDDAMRAYPLAELVKMIQDRDISAWKGGPDAWRLRYGELYEVPLDEWPEPAVEYPLIDAYETYGVWQQQEEKVGHQIKGDAFQTYAAFCLNLYAIQGMRTERVEVEALRARNVTKLGELQPELLREGLLAYEGPKKDPRRKLVKKRKVAQERIAATCRKNGVEPLLTKSGRKLVRKDPSVKGKIAYFAIDKKACFWAGDELLLRRAQYVSAEKMLNTYVPPLEQGSNLPISTRFGLAATTRVTSAAPGQPLVGTNLTNAPREGGVRECHVPREGCLYLAGDFSGAELHCLSQVCKDTVGSSKLGTLLKEGVDVHSYFAAALMGTDYDDLKLRVSQGDKEAKQARQDAKASNFGFGGYMHAQTFILTQLGFGKRYTLDRAEFMRAKWLETFPEMEAYFGYCKKLLGPKKDVTVPLWKDGPLRRIRKITVLCNSLFQARAARGAKGAAVAVAEECYYHTNSQLYGNTRPVNFIHDEIIAETKLADVNTLDARVRHFSKTMEDAFNAWVPDYPTTVDPVLMGRWYKAAETVKDKKGRVIEWTP